MRNFATIFSNYSNQAGTWNAIIKRSAFSNSAYRQTSLPLCNFLDPPPTLGALYNNGRPYTRLMHVAIIYCITLGLHYIKHC